MNVRSRTRAVSALAVVAMAVFAGPAQAGPLKGQLGILTPNTLAGNNPATGAPWAVGDQYRLAFHTSEKIKAESADISTYNAWVQGLADASGAYDIGEDDGVTWKVIGSTSQVDARDNTSTNPAVDGPGHAIFLLDGSTVIANNYEDLWDGEIQNPIGITELGTQWEHWPWTGTYWDGTKAPGHDSSFGALGDSVANIHQGQASATTAWIWRTWTGDPPDTELPMYALSEPLVVVGETDPTLPAVDAGGDVIAWSGEPVQLDPNIVDNGTSPLFFAWSADPPDGVEFSPIDVPNPIVIITKATNNPSTVTLTLAVSDLVHQSPVIDTMTIDVYDDACKAAHADGTHEYDSTDLNQDCITDFVDFALIAAAWLDDYAITEAQPLP